MALSGNAVTILTLKGSSAAEKDLREDHKLVGLEWCGAFLRTPDKTGTGSRTLIKMLKSMDVRGCMSRFCLGFLVCLPQCLIADNLYREAVDRLIVWRVENGQYACSAYTSAYCAARDPLPAQSRRDQTSSVGRDLLDQAPETGLWKVLPVILGDGSTFTITHTEANQKKYPL